MDYKEGKAPLFHRAVIESGASTSRAVRPYDAEIHARQFADYLQATGCPSDCPKDEILPYLRSLSSETVQKAQTKVFDSYNPSLQWAFQPVIDGGIIPRPPLQSWQSGKFHKVPIMTGFQRNEGSLYVDKQMDSPEQFTSFFATLLPLLSPEDIETIDKLYPDPSKFPDSPYLETRDKVGSQYKRIEAAYAHYAYVAPVRQTAELASAAMSPPVYVYQWALESSVIEGARHGDNMRYEAVDPSVAKISASQLEIARTTNTYITSFITTGDPNKIKPKDLPLPEWEPYTQQDPKAMVFGAENKELIGGPIGPSAQLLADTWGRKESEFWWSKVELSQQ
jgi:carboxylesterase type B